MLDYLLEFLFLYHKKYVNKHFQRTGVTSNAQVGKDFEVAAKHFFSSNAGAVKVEIRNPKRERSACR